MDTTKASTASTVQIERTGFHKLIATNPNYFGNLKESPFKPVFPILSNSSFEEATCLGYNPITNLLEAVIQIKQPAGYDGGPCQSGSFEYIRFFLDYGSGWEDAGFVAVHVNDIANANDCAQVSEKPLSFAASVQIQPKSNWCFFPVLPLARAILSWGAIPTAGDPFYVPVWGNVIDRHVQIRPRPILFEELAPVFDKEAVKYIPPAALETVAKMPIPLPDPGPLHVAELAKLYAAPTAAGRPVTVPSHRFGFAELSQAIHAQAGNAEFAMAGFANWKAAGIDWAAAMAALAEVNANVSYEQLDCVGLEGDPAFPRLVATLHIKQGFGYGGGLCTAGSTEYVAFWADWDDTCNYEYLGTVPVQVHDVGTIPVDGLSYNAVLPVDLSEHRLPCDKPKVARVRAVLSWAVPPSTTNPNALTYWGNLLDTHVQIQPGTVPNPLTPTISILGGIPTSEIDGTGLTTLNARFAGNNLLADALGRQCPFGGVVEVQGPEFPGYKYRIQVRRTSGGSWQDVATPLWLTRWDGTTYLSSPDASNFFEYQTYANNIENLLGNWFSGGDDQWQVKLEIADMSDNPVLGSIPDIHTIQLDNTAPVATVHIDSSGDCGKFAVGAVLAGHFVATDANFGSYGLGTEPFAGPITPGGAFTPTAPAPGDVWSLNTSTMQPCGYVVQLNVWDRSIVNSAWGAHNFATSSVGFCLLKSL